MSGLYAKIGDRNWLWTALVLCALVLAAGIGQRGPSPPDEPRFLLAAQQMVASGEWLIPSRGSEVYAHKPPVFMWVQAIAFSLVRNWEIAFMLPSLVAALATLWLTYDCARFLWGRQVGMFALCALVLTIQFCLQAKRAQIDMLLVAMTTTSMWAILRYWFDRGDGWLLLIAGGAAGLGTVTKGVGFLPLLIFLPYALSGRIIGNVATVNPIGKKGWGLLGAGFVLGASVWLLPLALRWLNSDDQALNAYVQEILLRQTASRYTQPWHHIKPYWYYIEVIFTLWLPGALLLPWLVPIWWRKLRASDLRYVLLLGWVVLVLAFFSISPGKREVYIFPALPVICLAAAPLLPVVLRISWARWVLLFYVLTFSIVLVAISILGLWGSSEQLTQLQTDRGINDEDLFKLLVGCLLIGIPGLLSILILRVRRVVFALCIFTGLLWLNYGLLIAPSLDQSSSAKQLMADVEAHLKTDDRLAMLGWREQHLLQAKRSVTEFGFERTWANQWPPAQAWLLEDTTAHWLFVVEDATKGCVDPLRTVFVGRSNRRNWLLLRADALIADCSQKDFSLSDQDAQ